MRQALTLAVVGVATLAAHAQTRQAPTFRTKIDLVQVDVVVVDADGVPVRGLNQADFAVLDRGKPQAIAAFQEVARHHEGEAPAPLRSIRRDVSMNQGAQADRLVVMVLDDLHIYKERTDRAKEIARKIVTELGGQSSMAVLFTSGDHSTQVTQDPAAITAAVETLKGRQSWRRPHHGSDQMHGARIDPEDSIDTTLSKIQSNQDAGVQDFVDNMRQ